MNIFNKYKNVTTCLLSSYASGIFIVINYALFHQYPKNNFMKKSILVLFAYFIVSLGYAQKNDGVKFSVKDGYHYSLDLTKVKDDKVNVSLVTPKLPKNLKEVVFSLPKIVPGTYSISDFGRFISEFKAYGKNGKLLKVDSLDNNRWRISDAQKLHKISYWVEDSFDSKTKDVIFEPAGSNIEENVNFMVNTHSFFGYLHDIKRQSFEVSITKPQGFYGSTALRTKTSTATTDTYVVPSYMELADSPIMYNKPDTTVMMIGGAEVLVAVHSPTGKISSKFVAENVKPILEAQKEYLGGKLPVNKYAFILYFFTGSMPSGAAGALEHSYSSVYSLPEDPTQVQMIKDVAAHEFFHIVTPLSIHSEEIHNFDFIDPKMSKHLWMYEGVTEYFAGHMQAKAGLLPLEQYLKVMQGKMRTASLGFNDNLAFTELSSECLGAQKEQYGNVYQKGALIGMCLDLKLNKLSGGKYSVRQLMFDLSKEYGKEKAFQDAELFDKIATITKYPELRQFFADYVEAAKPLPYAELLQTVGIEYAATTKRKRVSFGGFNLKFDADKNLVIDASRLDSLGKAMGYQDNDIIYKINGTLLTFENRQELLEPLFTQSKAGEPFSMVVKRKENDVLVEKELTCKKVELETTVPHAIKVTENPTSEQLELRKAWIK
jgi:predicted metalloprotease with PDZ domain